MIDDDTTFGLLSDKRILQYLDDGEIVIHPFNKNNLKTSSYDVTLGSSYYREQYIKDEESNNIYNIYSKEGINKVWGTPQEALPYSYYKERGIFLENINDADKIIFINPGETILAHTNEFIGGVSRTTTMMKARSSMGRSFIEVCKCAGMGDVGYFNRWTMEITNNSRKYRIPLVVNRRIAQIVFFDVGEILDKNYNNAGKYQTSTVLDTLIKTWKPDDMLPKLYSDYEIGI
jgi:dCTP deaminase